MWASLNVQPNSIPYLRRVKNYFHINAFFSKIKRKNVLDKCRAFILAYLAMERELQILKKKYGSWQAVASKLQITYRHVCHIRSGSRPAGKALQTLIKIYARQIEDLE